VKIARLSSCKNFVSERERSLYSMHSLTFSQWRDLRMGVIHHALYEQSLATDPASTADKTSLVPDLYTVHYVVWFGDVDTYAGGSTDAGGLSHALPTYDPRDIIIIIIIIMRNFLKWPK